MQYSSGIRAVREWFGSCGWTPFGIQEKVWQAVAVGNSGFLHAPPGSGKTSALLLAALIQYMNDPLADEHHTGLRLLWITPRRTRATELREVIREQAEVFDIDWSIAVRGGDNYASVKKRQRRHSPHALFTTPGNLHILLSEPGYRTAFDSLHLVVVDEWHELAGTKTGVQTELALARVAHIAPRALLWCSSAQHPDTLRHALPAIRACRPLVVEVETVEGETNTDELPEEPVDCFGSEGTADHRDIFRRVECEARQQVPDAAQEFPGAGIAFDVLVQYCLTLACSDGCTADEVYSEVITTSAFRQLTRRDFEWVLDFITHGTASHIGETRCRVQNLNGLYRTADPAAALQHRMHIGTTDDVPPADHNPEGGQSREQSIATVEPDGVTAAAVWAKDRLLPLPLVQMVRQIIGEVGAGVVHDSAMEGAFSTQQHVSAIPNACELLVESVVTPAGHHLFLYPFEGRTAHQHLAVLLAWRIVQQQPAAIRIAVNEYGIELLAGSRLPIERFVGADLFSSYGLDNMPEINLDRPARHRFRDIARTAGITIATGKDEQEAGGYLSSDHIFEAWKKYDRGNVLLQQAYNEVRACYPNEEQLRGVLDRLAERELVIAHPKQLSPFALALWETL